MSQLVRSPKSCKCALRHAPRAASCLCGRRANRELVEYRTKRLEGAFVGEVNSQFEAVDAGDVEQEALCPRKQLRVAACHRGADILPALAEHAAPQRLGDA